MLGNFHDFLSSAEFFKIKFFETFFMQYYQSAEQLERIMTLATVFSIVIYADQLDLENCVLDCHEWVKGINLPSKLF